MIRRRTVFVLGAGASQPYGLPLGSELSELLYESNPNSERSKWLYENCGISPTELANFSESFLKAGRTSIDSFLANRTGYNQIGKMAIAYELCRREDPKQVFRPSNKDNWYSKLWDAMVEDPGTHQAISANSVRFITFNYDRSLEFFLHEAIKHNFEVDDQASIEAWSKIKILHVYGLLGNLNHASGYHPYHPDINGKTLQLAANGIKVIPESREDDKDFELARNWFEWAEQIVFLGFGFDPLNVKRLGLDSVLDWSRERKKQIPTIWASVYGKTLSEQQIISESLCPKDNWLPLEFTNLGVLRNSRILA